MKLTRDELNLILTCIGIVLNIVTEDDQRSKLEALQTKLMNERDG